MHLSVPDPSNRMCIFGRALVRGLGARSLAARLRHQPTNLFMDSRRERAPLFPTNQLFCMRQRCFIIIVARVCRLRHNCLAVKATLSSSPTITTPALLLLGPSLLSQHTCTYIFRVSCVILLPLKISRYPSSHCANGRCAARLGRAIPVA